jgi:leucyl aminopeptidase
VKILPPVPGIAVAARDVAATDVSLSRADAAIFVLDRTRPEAALRKLPHAAIWSARYRAEKKTGPAPILTARLPNARHTLMVVGFAKPGASGFERLELAGKLAREALKPGGAKLQLHAPGLAAGDKADMLEALLSAALAAAAPMPQRKSKRSHGSDLRQVLVASRPDPRFDVSVAIAEGNHLARWLTALPPNELDCVGYRRALRELATREGWGFRFYDEAALKRLGAGAFLAVARANSRRGAGIVRLTYRPRRRARQRIALVGKGICFDTGGINLKPHRSMYLMHGDMQGSAVAVGTLLALDRMAAPYAVDCWLALTENQIGPDAYRPQEVVAAMNGVTIQVVHSDAEGRMVLADTLALASREQPDFMIDFATLTGACVNALTERYSGAFTNRSGLHDWLQSVGRASGERVWCFPMDEDFDGELDSPIADIMQCTLDNKGDHVLAARFLSRFVAPAIPWVHVDLSAAERKGGLAHVPTEFTGFGVRYACHVLGDPARLHDRLTKATA